MKRFVILQLAVMIAAMGLGQAFAEEAKRPNVVLIMADDLGYECIAANGGTSYETPVLDRLAETGARFDHCYSQPLCTPSRVKLMTGIYNVRNYVKFGLLDPDQTTFAHLFKNAGYATCVVGKWQLLGGLEGPNHFGFDEYCLWQLTRRPSRYASPGVECNGELLDFKGEGYGPDVVADYACDFIERNADKPFLLYYPMIITHCPFEPTPDSADWDPASPSPDYKGKAKYFGDMVTYMDKIVGRLVEQLEASGVRENTLIIFTGDNGTDEPVVSMMGETAVPGHKGRTTDGGTRVPLIVNWPGVVKEGVVSQDLVDFSDMLPTICDAASVDVPEDLAKELDGRSFLPLCKGEAGDPRQWIYIWYARDGKTKVKEFTRNQRYKLYRTGEFYDVPNDVFEESPLADDELSDEAGQAKAMLQEALDKYSGTRGNMLKEWPPKKEKK